MKEFILVVRDEWKQEHDLEVEETQARTSPFRRKGMQTFGLNYKWSSCRASINSCDKVVALSLDMR